MPEETAGPDDLQSLLKFLGTEVRRMRLAAELTQAQLARLAFATQAMISYVEAGKRIPSEPTLQDIDRALGAGGFLARLHPLLVRHAYPTWFLPYVELERDASRLRVWQGQTVPGLLQTEAYARLVLSAARPTDLDDLVAARMTRQQVLEREDRPRAWFVVDEAVLDGFGGDDDVRRDQLAHLLRVAEDPRTVLQVLPRHRPAHPGLSGAFGIVDLPEGQGVVYADAFHRGRMTAEREEYDAAEHAYDLLRALALPPRESADLIRSHAEAAAAGLTGAAGARG